MIFTEMISLHKFGQVRERPFWWIANFTTKMHKNRLKKDQERMFKLSWMLNANVMKICYKNSAKYQLSKRAIDVK
jgi:hypothetical protein